MPLAVDAQFTVLMDDMSDFSNKIQDYIKDGSTQREWMIPSGKDPMWVFQPHNVPELGDPFDRTDVGAEYADEYSGTGTNEIRAVMGTHIQLGYMGMMERAFRERHRICTRALLLVAGRRLAHADTTYGIHKVGVEGYVSELFNA